MELRSIGWRRLSRGGISGALLAAMVTFGVGCGGASSSPSAGATKKGEIAIGISSNNTASYAAMAQGVQGYLSMVNDQGGVNGYTFNTEVLNNDATAAGGATSVRQLLQKQPAMLVVVGSAAYSAAAGVIKQVSPDLPVAAMASATVVQASGLKNAFGASANYPGECGAEADWAHSTLKATSVAIVYEDDAIGQDVGKQCPGIATRLGMKATGIAVAPTTTNFGPIASQIKESNANVVMVYAQTPYMVGVQKAAAAIGVTAKWVTFSTNDDTYVKLAGSVAEGTYVDRWLYALDEQNQAITQFSQYQTKAFGASAVTGLGLQGWTTGAVIVAAVKKATASGKAPDGPSIAAAVRSLSGPVGGSPNIDYAHTDGSSGVTQVLMYQVTNGTFKKVGGPIALKAT